MEILLAGLVCAATGAIVSIIGFVLLDPGGTARVEDKGTSAASRATLPATSGFTPLELAPVPMRWPSEAPWPAAGVTLMPWPSETWTDDFFDRKMSPSLPAEKPPSHARDGAAPSHPQPQRPTRTNPSRRAPPAEVIHDTPPSKKPKRTAAPRASAVVEQAVAAVADRTPSVEDVIHWAETDGLAKTVARIQETTGWDFQRSAHHLAWVMRQRRGK
jgi:hypothetical protein